MKTKTLLLTGTILMLCLMCIGSAMAEETLTLRYAKGFQAESLDGCTVITVQPAWQKEGGGFRYLLVPRGHKVPAGHPTAQVIRVPVRRVVSLSTTHLPYIDAAGQTGRLVGLGGFDYVNTPSVRQRINEGKLKEVGNFTSLRMETVIDLAPDLILAPASGSAYDVHHKLIEAGLPVFLIIDHLEHHPLGRLEWIKLLAMLFDTRAHADKLFAETAARYNALANKARHVAQRPKVITNTPFQGQWWIARGNSFVAQFIADAGGDYCWSHIPGVGSVPMDIEAVYERALSADFWLNTGTWKNLSETETSDPRFAAIAALKQKRLYNNNKRLNAGGGNDYWESGMLRPDVVLADLVAILHPELLPGHELVYYRWLE